MSECIDAFPIGETDLFVYTTEAFPCGVGDAFVCSGVDQFPDTGIDAFPGPTE